MEKNKFELVPLLKELGADVVKEMTDSIKLNGTIGTGRLLNNIKVTANKTDEKYNLVITYPFYGTFADEGRRPGTMPPLDDIKKWTKLKGIPESAAFPIALKIAKKGTKGINFTKHFYDDIKKIADSVGEQYGNFILVEILNELNK